MARDVQYLSVFPKRIIFTSPFDDEKLIILRLMNHANERMAIKVKTTTPLLEVSAAHSFVTACKVKCLGIICASFDYDANVEYDDHLTLCYSAVAEDDTSDAFQFWKRAKNWNELRVPVLFIDRSSISKRRKKKKIKYSDLLKMSAEERSKMGVRASCQPDKSKDQHKKMDFLLRRVKEVQDIEDSQQTLDFSANVNESKLKDKWVVKSEQLHYLGSPQIDSALPPPNTPTGQHGFANSPLDADVYAKHEYALLANVTGSAKAPAAKHNYIIPKVKQGGNAPAFGLPALMPLAQREGASSPPPPPMVEATPPAAMPVPTTPPSPPQAINNDLVFKLLPPPPPKEMSDCDKQLHADENVDLANLKKENEAREQALEMVKQVLRKHQIGAKDAPKVYFKNEPALKNANAKDRPISPEGQQMEQGARSAFNKRGADDNDVDERYNGTLKEAAAKSQQAVAQGKQKDHGISLTLRK